MIELEEASQRILDVIHPAEEEIVALSEIDGRVLAEDLTAPINLPTFDNSAMDGFAVRASEAATGARLRSTGEVAAGIVFEDEVCEGECVRIFTGSPIPAGTNAVVMQEDARVEGEKVDSPGHFLELEEMLVSMGQAGRRSSFLKLRISLELEKVEDEVEEEDDEQDLSRMLDDRC